jgi:hypothetical protein
LNSASNSDNNDDNNENTAIGHDHSFQRAGSKIEREIHSGYRLVLLYAFVFILGFYLRGHSGSIHQLASEWLFTLAFLYEGTYCVRNFVHCREAHCIVTGTGWTLIGLLSPFQARFKSYHTATGGRTGLASFSFTSPGSRSSTRTTRSGERFS